MCLESVRFTQFEKAAGASGKIAWQEMSPFQAVWKRKSQKVRLHMFQKSSIKCIVHQTKISLELFRRCSLQGELFLIQAREKGNWGGKWFLTDNLSNKFNSKNYDVNLGLSLIVIMKTFILKTYR